jgi:hypothetical protein
MKYKLKANNLWGRTNEKWNGWGEKFPYRTFLIKYMVGR